MSKNIEPEKFYSLFLKKIKRSGIELTPWNNSRQWTERLLKGNDCVMSQIAKEIKLTYCDEYWKLDGIFCEGFMPKDPMTQANIEKYKWAHNIKIIVEVENASATLWKEIWKLIPLFFSPLKVIITYPKDEQEAEKIKDIIKDRIKNDDQYRLHKSKIKILLIFGFKEGNKISWQGFTYNNKKFKIINTIKK
ncbi:MAG: hypothetical protein WC389_18780 [Lutibacter sp.]|jgi:hypothetical protein